MLSAALLWLLLGLALLALELLAGLDADGLLAGGLAALLVSALAGLLALPPLLQIGLFAGLSALLLAGLARWSKRRRQRGIPPAAGGAQAEVISGFGSRSEGRVLWQGQSWAATNLDAARPLAAGDTVEVMGREGTQLQVMAGPAGG
ncbi:MAG: NfeD family protein [Prochlorococcaceae cyanobacterium]